MHARSDDFEATVEKARQYMDAPEQAKMAAIGKKRNVRFAMSDPEPNQIQPILDGLQKVLQTVLDNQNQRPEVKIGEMNTPNSGGSKKKNSKLPSSAASNASNSTQGSGSRQNQGNDSFAQGREQYQDFGQSSNWHSNSAGSQIREPLGDQRQGAQAPHRDGGPVQNDRPPQDWPTSGCEVKKIALLGVEVVMFVVKGTATLCCIVAILTKQDSLWKLALHRNVVRWKSCVLNLDRGQTIRVATLAVGRIVIPRST